MWFKSINIPPELLIPLILLKAPKILLIFLASLWDLRGININLIYLLYIYIYVCGFWRKKNMYNFNLRGMNTKLINYIYIYNFIKNEKKKKGILFPNNSNLNCDEQNSDNR